MEDKQPGVDTNSSEIDLLDLVKKLWAKRIYLIKAAGVGAIVGLIIAFSIPREYTTTIKMAPEGINATQGGSMADLAALAGVNLDNTKGNSEGINLILYPDVINSTPFIVELSQALVKGQKMDSTMTFYDYLDTQVVSPWWGYVISAPMKALGWVFSLIQKKEVEPSSINPYMLTKKQNKVLERLKNNIMVAVDKKTGVITVAATTQDPVVAAVVADSIVNKLQSYIFTYRTEKAVRDLAYTQKLYDEAQQKYYEAQRRNAYAADANTHIAKQSARVELDRLQNEQQLTFSVYNQMAQQLEKAKMKVQEQTPCVTIIEPASVPVKKSNMSKAMILIAFVFLGGCVGVGKIVIPDMYLSDKQA